jgi:sugar/nucleoside kinase (ribokinase family)
LQRPHRPKYASRTRRGLLAAGNWLLDHVHVVDLYPQPGQLGNILSRIDGAGGGAYNVLAVLARCGAPFPLLGAGLVGNDDAGRQIREDCRRHKIDARHLRSSAGAPTSFTHVVTEQPTGRRTFLHYRGANALWRGEDLDFHRIRARIFHFGYLMLLDQMDQPDARFGTRAARLLAAARTAGLKTSVDAASVESRRFSKVASAALKHADYCILNELEAGKITGLNPRRTGGRLDPVALRRSVDALLKLGVGELVVVHCPEGALARLRNHDLLWQPSLKLPADYIAGTAGAGDAFCAGVLLGLHEGWNLPRSLRAGVCIAAASLSHPTTTGGVRSLRRCLALANRFGFNPPFDSL